MEKLLNEEFDRNVFKKRSMKQDPVRFDHAAKPDPQPLLQCTYDASQLFWLILPHLLPISVSFSTRENLNDREGRSADTNSSQLVDTSDMLLLKFRVTSK